MIIGPISAVQIQKLLERNRSSYKRKEDIFKELMATRGSILSKEHVEALNRIEIEFGSSKKYKNVIEAWKVYFDHLCQKTDGEASQVQWNNTRFDLHTELLYQMSTSLNYKFDKLAIKRNVYLPEYFAQTEKEQVEIKELIKKILNGSQRILIKIDNEDQ